MSIQTNVTPIRNAARDLRRARGEFVDALIKADDRSARYVALQIGLNPSSMGERLRGKSPFLADELEGIARVLKIDPVEFYKRYIEVGPAGIEPTTSTVETRQSGEREIVSLAERRAAKQPLVAS